MVYRKYANNARVFLTCTRTTRIPYRTHVRRRKSWYVLGNEREAAVYSYPPERPDDFRDFIH